MNHERHLAPSHPWCLAQPEEILEPRSDPRRLPTGVADRDLSPARQPDPFRCSLPQQSPGIRRQPAFECAQQTAARNLLEFVETAQAVAERFERRLHVLITERRNPRMLGGKGNSSQESVDLLRIGEPPHTRLQRL